MARFAVIGATGFIGSPISFAVLEADHECVLVTRSRIGKNEALIAQYEQLGAEIQVASPDDVSVMRGVLAGTDVVVCAMGEPGIYGRVEYEILAAAQAAGVKRFIPNEFGIDTLRLPYGSGALFDEKKRFQEALISSGMAYTIIFNGGAFDYFLPNLRVYDAITTYGDDFEVPYYTHARADIAAITVRAAMDQRCENQYIHLKHNLVTQNQVLQELTANFPDDEFPRAHVPSEEILDGTHEVNAAIWINGHCSKADPRSMDAAELFPDYRFASTSDALGDPEFVFGVEKP